MMPESRKIVRRNEKYIVLKPDQFEGGFHSVGRGYSPRGLADFLKENATQYLFEVSSELTIDSEFREIADKVDGLQLMTE